MISYCACPMRGCLDRALLEHRRSFSLLSHLLRALLSPQKGAAKVVLNCAHRTSTFLSCAFCEHGGRLGTPFPSLSALVIRPRIHDDRHV
jgi:hypothetical protein